MIGWLGGGSPNAFADVAAAFRKGVADLGFVEGKTVAIEYRWAEGRYERLPALAAELVGRRVAAIMARGGTTSTLAAKEATSTIPIVFTAPRDPVALGLVDSLNRPGGNEVRRLSRERARKGPLCSTPPLLRCVSVCETRVPGG